jgi:hypothetical protein
VPWAPDHLRALPMKVPPDLTWKKAHSVAVGRNVGDIEDGGTSRPVGQKRERKIRRAEEERVRGIEAISKMSEAVSEMVKCEEEGTMSGKSGLGRAKTAQTCLTPTIYCAGTLASGSAKHTQLDSVMVEKLMAWVAPHQGIVTVGRAPDCVVSHPRSSGVESQPSENERDECIHQGEQNTAQLRAADGSVLPSSSFRSVFDEEYENKDDEEVDQD